MNRKLELARLLTAGYEDWRRKRLAQDYSPGSVSQSAFCKEFGLSKTSFSGWINAQYVPTDMDNINALAACPYIGPRIFSILMGRNWMVRIIEKLHVIQSPEAQRRIEAYVEEVANEATEEQDENRESEKQFALASV